MTKLFEIKKESVAKDDAVLLCEIGDTYACTATYDPVAKEINNLEYYTFPPAELTDNITKIFSAAVAGERKQIIGSAFAEAVMVPYALFRQDAAKDYFENIPTTQMLHDHIAEWQVVTAYTFPKSVLDIVNKENVQFFHNYTTTLKVYNGFDAENQVSVHFSPQRFRVVVKKEGKLQLAQTYTYTVPLDVVYYLLSIYQQFDLPKEETYLLLSGLVEEESALYKELHGYFLNLHFNAGSVTTPVAGYPAHYFTSLFNLAACA